MLTGGCQCGDVRYEAAGEPYNCTVCHCSMCRRSAGAPFVAWFSVKESDFRIVSGALTLYESSENAGRGFCGRCGTSLVYRNAYAGDEIDVTAASLDDPDAATPRDHVFTETRLSWVKLDDGLPQYRRARSEG